MGIIKMDDHDSPSFKFGVNDDIPDPVFQMKRKSRRVEKVSHKGTFVSVFLFFLVGVLVFIAYLDIKKKISAMHVTGNTEIQTLSEGWEKKYSSLSLKYAKVEEALAKKVAPMDEIFLSLEATTNSLKDKLKKLETRLDKFDAGEKKQASAIDEIDKKLASVSEGMKTGDTEKLTEELAMLSAALNETREELNKIKDVAHWPPSATIDKETLDIAIAEQDKVFQNKLDLIMENLQSKESKMELIQNKLNKLEKMSKSFVRKSSKTPGGLHPIDTIRPKSGTFTED